MDLTFKNVLKGVNNETYSKELLSSIDDITSLIILCSISFVNPPAAIVGAIANKLLLKKTITNIGNQFIKQFGKTTIDVRNYEIAYILIHFTSFFDTLSDKFPSIIREIGLSNSDKLFIINQGINTSKPNIEDLAEFKKYNTEIGDYELQKISSINKLSPEEYLIKLYDKLSEGFIDFLKKLMLWDNISLENREIMISEINDLKIEAINKFENQLITLTIKNSGFRSWLNRNENKQIETQIKSIANLVNDSTIICSIPTSINAHIRKIQKIDPNLDVEIKYDGNSITEYLKPKNPDNLKISIKSKNKEEIKNFFDYGKQIRFKPFEIDVIGSKYIEKRIKDVENLVIELRKKHYTSNIQLIINEPELCEVFIFTGSTYFGNKNSTFEGSSLNDSLKVQMRLRNIKKLSVENFTLRYDLFSWRDNNILSLKHFDKLLKFFNFIENDISFTIKFSLEENEIFSGKIKLAKNKLTIFNKLDLINDCRIISRYFRINPLLPEFETLENHRDYIEMIKQLISSEIYCVKKVNKNITLNVKFSKSFIAHRKVNVSNAYDLMLVSQSNSINFFGESIDVGTLIWLYSNWKITKNEEPNNDQNDNSTLQLIKLEDSTIKVFIKPKEMQINIEQNEVEYESH